jgi:hypothetical protein
MRRAPIDSCTKSSSDSAWQITADPVSIFLSMTEWSRDRRLVANHAQSLAAARCDAPPGIALLVELAIAEV